MCNVESSVTEVRGFRSNNNISFKKDDSVFKSTGTMFGSVATVGLKKLISNDSPGPGLFMGTFH